MVFYHDIFELVQLFSHARNVESQIVTLLLVIAFICLSVFILVCLS